MDDLSARLAEILKEKQNIVLIGMPSCGKTTLGKLLAQELGKEFIDTDLEIVKKAGMQIPEIFEKFGEEYFRNLESEVIKELSVKQSLVIATGGGAVLRPENVDALRQNGKIIFIDRPLDMLTTTDDRPLSSSRELLEERYYERYATYCFSCDVRINADGDINTNLERIKEGGVAIQRLKAVERGFHVKGEGGLFDEQNLQKTVVHGDGAVFVQRHTADGKHLYGVFRITVFGVSVSAATYNCAAGSFVFIVTPPQ